MKDKLLFIKCYSIRRINEYHLRVLCLVASLLLLLPGFLIAQQIIPLYNGAIPNSIATPNEEYVSASQFYFKVTQPTLTIYLPGQELANGTAVIICPGGGYGGLSMKHEGWDVAENFNRLGIAAFILKYRLPSDLTMKDKSIGPIQDAQRAIQMVRENAVEWKIDPGKIGIIGFSAGGHLASTAITHFDRSYIENVKGISLRPDFSILVYPVISFADSLTHRGSRDALIGKKPTDENVRLFSNELQVTPQTPPTFLIHAEDDKLVSVKNSIVFFEALLKNKVPAGMHLFPKGEHGFPLEPAKSGWFNYCALWLRENGWLK